MNIRWHNQRFNSSRFHLFGIKRNDDLRKFIKVPTQFQSGIVKCRIIYNVDINRIEFEPYKVKPIQSLRAIHSTIDYVYKYEDRSELQRLYERRGGSDDILIIKGGFVTDTFYGNVAFRKNSKWYTPSEPLLTGTRRMNLLNRKKLVPIPIPLSSINQYSHICIYNSMILFGEIIIPVSNISVE